MVAVIQRVSEAKVTISNVIYSSIGSGFLILLGVGHSDSVEDINWLVQKISNMRILPDNEAKMNLSIKDTDGEVLVVSQFTLFANIKKGNRPSFTEAARPEIAMPLYEQFIATLQSQLSSTVKTGKFGADMKVGLVNYGPVTIILDSKQRSL